MSFVDATLKRLPTIRIVIMVFVVIDVYEENLLY